MCPDALVRHVGLHHRHLPGPLFNPQEGLRGVFVADRVQGASRVFGVQRASRFHGASRVNRVHRACFRHSSRVFVDAHTRQCQARRV